MSDFEDFLEDLEAEIKSRGGFPREFTEEIAEDLLYDLAIDHNAQYCHGISKAVIVFNNDDCVIKIPFNGYFDDCWCEDDDEYEEEFIPFCCAWGTEWDYCGAERNVYKRAEDAGIAEYFAETAFLKEIEGYPIYIQPKMVDYETLVGDDGPARNSWEDRNKTIQHCKESGLSRGGLDSDWLTDFANYWGQEALDSLLNFIDILALGDLHNQNVGYLGTRPMLLDYSDFLDGCN